VLAVVDAEAWAERFRVIVIVVVVILLAAEAGALAMSNAITMYERRTA